MEVLSPVNPLLPGNDLKITMAARRCRKVQFTVPGPELQKIPITRGTYTVNVNSTLGINPHAQDIQVVTKLRLLRRKSKSTSDLTMTSHLTLENFQNFQTLEARKNRLSSSLRGLNEKSNGWGFIGNSERCTAKMEACLEYFLEKYLYNSESKPFRVRSASKILRSTDSFFSILRFISELLLSVGYLPISPPNFKKIEGKQLVDAMINYAMNLGQILGIKIRKSDLRNPSAIFSRPRVIYFLYSLTMIIEKKRDDKANRKGGIRRL